MESCYNVFVTSTRLLTVRDVAGLLGVSRKTVQRMAAVGTLPKPLKVGNGARLARWSLADVTAYLDGLRKVGGDDDRGR